jgi:hypothetical protein
MSKSGLKHIDVGAELTKTEWESEESHELIHGTSFPSSPVERQLFYRDDEHKWYIYNGTEWVWLGGGGGMQVHGNEYHDPDFEQQGVAATLIETHRTSAVHTQPQPPAEHGNEKHDPDLATEAALAAHAAATTGVHGAGPNYLAQAPTSGHLVRTFTKGWTSGKYLKGAGVNADPTEYDFITDFIIPVAGEVLRQTPTANSPFTAKINGTPTSTSVVYDTDTSEGSLEGISTGSSYWGRIILYNTTRGNSRKIVSVNTATNTITTELSSDNWADNDDITTHSPTVQNDFFDVDLSAQISSDVKAIDIFGFLADTSGNYSSSRIVRYHPYTTYDDGKRCYIPCRLGNDANTLYFIMPVYSQKVSMNYVSITSGLTITSVKGVLK